MTVSRAASRVFVLGVNCVVFYCSCLSTCEQTWIPVERSFGENSVRGRSFEHRAKAATLNAAERRRPDVQAVLFRISDPAFSYEELPASAGAHLNANLTTQLLALSGFFSRSPPVYSTALPAHANRHCPRLPPHTAAGRPVVDSPRRQLSAPRRFGRRHGGERPRHRYISDGAGR